MRSAGHGLQPVVKFLLDVARALQYVHSRQILHSSVKLPNVMLGNNGDVKLIDFGRSLDLDSIPLANLKYNAGTARYVLRHFEPCVNAFIGYQQSVAIMHVLQSVIKPLSMLPLDLTKDLLV